MGVEMFSWVGFCKNGCEVDGRGRVLGILGLWFRSLGILIFLCVFWAGMDKGLWLGRVVGWMGFVKIISAMKFGGILGVWERIAWVGRAGKSFEVLEDCLWLGHGLAEGFRIGFMEIGFRWIGFRLGSSAVAFWNSNEMGWWQVGERMMIEGMEGGWSHWSIKEGHSSLIPIDTSPRVRACKKVPKHMSPNTSTRLRRDNNDDAPQG